MSIDILKRDAQLLLKITEKYLDLLEANPNPKLKKKVEAYINSVLENIEKHIDENVKGSIKAVKKAT